MLTTPRYFPFKARVYQPLHSNTD